MSEAKEAYTYIACIETEIALSITGVNVYYCMTNDEFDADAWCDKFCNEELHEMLLKWYIS